MPMIDSSEIKKQAAREIVQTIGIPVMCLLLFIAWLYVLIRSLYLPILVFPLSCLILVILYFFSGSVYSGILLGMLTLLGFVNVVLTKSSSEQFIFVAQIIWLWTIFLLFEKFQHTYFGIQNTNRENREVLETKTATLEGKINQNERRKADINQQIANYQMLGRMTQMFGTTLQEDKLVQLIEETAEKFIGKGAWKIIRSSEQDEFSNFIESNNLALLVRSLQADKRFFVDADFQSLIAVPLEVNGRFRGILKGTAPQADVFEESDLRLLSVLGGIASLALNNVSLYQKTQELAITDGLTGLYVQKYFKQRLSEEIQRSRLHKLPLSVTIVDIDFFKNFNDTYGHAAGDAVIRQISSYLRRRLRETDFICRYGGEEFAVIMLQTDLKEAAAVCEDIRRGVETERFFLPLESFQPLQVHVTVSVGIAGFNEKVQNGESFLALADKMLYDAKLEGRNKVRYTE
ncbi:MAG: diguanylate cyclase [Elusimicrobiota bacterium]